MAIRRVVIDDTTVTPTVVTPPRGARVTTIPAGKLMDGVKVFAPVGDQYAGWSAKKRDDDLNV